MKSFCNWLLARHAAFMLAVSLCVLFLTVTSNAFAMGCTVPTAYFINSPACIAVGSNVTFTDASAPCSGAIGVWAWTFEGGTPPTSTTQNPIVTYTVAGSYSVALTVNGANTFTKTGYVSVGVPLAVFTGSQTTVCQGNTIGFTDQSSGCPTSWSWVFEGGTPGTSTSQNPFIVYNTAGTYSVSLTATNTIGSSVPLVKTGYITVNASAAPVTYTVTVLTDNGGVDPAVGGGTGTLRQAIVDANANSVPDIISFSAGGTGTITLAAALPALTDNCGVTIDGSTAPSYTVNTNLTGGLNGTLKVEINANAFTPGITVSSDNNVIRGLNIRNAAKCISLTAGADNNRILGCYIGTSLAGTASGGGTDGIVITSGAYNRIGDGSAAGRNLISGLNAATGAGIEIAGTSTGTTIKGNIIGLQKDGSTYLATTQYDGVVIDPGGTVTVTNTTIGGTVTGEGNVISGNASAGIQGANNSSILGNIIGPQADGISYVTSNAQAYGISFFNGSNTTIGGNTDGARNIISANEAYGVMFFGNTDVRLQGNYIGLDKTGTAFPPGSTQDAGVAEANANVSGVNVIGGIGAGEGNVISGNKDATSQGKGVQLSHGAGAGTPVLGNIIGPQADGTSLVPSNAQTFGVYIWNTTSDNTIGSSAGMGRNIISANETYGVFMKGGPDSKRNSVKGNFIGPSSATVAITGSSQDYGVYIDGLIFVATNNTIGGSAAGEANTIAFNTVEGVYLAGGLADFNLISRNPIYSNGTPIGTGKPINLGAGSNNNKAIPVITTANTGTVVGTSAAGDVVEVFKNTIGPPCYDAVTFVGAATADGSGNWSLTGLSLTLGDYLLATATDGSNNTSEFTICTGPLPVELLSFSAVCLGNKAEIKWITASETNNDYFTIERANSLPSGGLGWAWKVIGTVQSAGNSSTIKHYSFIDTEPPTGKMFYYRLKQTDFDAKYEYFNPASCSCKVGIDIIDIYPNPSNGNFSYTINSSEEAEVSITVSDIIGKKVIAQKLTINKGINTQTIDASFLSSGMYYFQVKTSNGLYKTQKQLCIK